MRMHKRTAMSWDCRYRQLGATVPRRKSRNIALLPNSPITHKALTMNGINDDFFYLKCFPWRETHVVDIFHICKISNISILQNNRSLNLSGDEKSTLSIPDFFFYIEFKENH